MSKKFFVVLLFFISKTILLSQSTVSDPLYADKSRGEWTLMVIPDTQGYAENWTEEGFLYSEMKQTFEWIASVADQLNIKLVQSVGDMVETNTKHDWKNVRECYSILNKAGIPAIPLAGNHEWKDGGGPGDYALMNSYFKVSDYEKKSWWGGFYKGMQNTYQILDIGSEKYLFISMQYKASTTGAQDAVDWVVKVITDHPDRKIIFSSHWHDKQPHFKQTIDVFPNIIMTLAGHVTSEQYYVANNRTHCFVQDYQDFGFSAKETGDMQIRFYKFKPLEDKVEWFTYSAVTAKFWTKNPNSQGTFSLAQND